ncbi:MAG: potassium transporter [Legionellales bacterium]|nr:potassium transporter [Legionellales bacterium]|tara:strand:+ start:457 stop:2490 length:2034 start_codon:yes stop_codon:yes gene_type:complete
MIFEQILSLMLLSVLFVAVLRKLHLPPLLGYVLTGCIIGPAGFDFLAGVNELEFIAELGVVFLLFTIGLELSIRKLIAMRSSLIQLGGLQVLICACITMGIALWVGLTFPAALTIAGALALSSTAIASKLLVEQDELHATHGRLAFSILLFQDLAAIPFLVIVPALGTASGQHDIASILGLALVKGALAVLLIIAGGRFFIRPLFHVVASARSTELFMLTALLVVIFSAWLTEHLGLSMALGSFLAGVVMAETEYCHQIESDIQPFRDILLGLFFITVGMKVNPASLVLEWQSILMIVTALILVKTLVIATLARFLGGAGARPALKTGLVLAQGGEFGFALLTLAFDTDIISVTTNEVMLSSIVLSMILAPFFIRHNRTLAAAITRDYSQTALSAEECQTLADASETLSNHVILCGYGRVGQALARFLEHEGVTYIGLDMDPARLKEAKALKEPVYYGDASEIQTLERAGIEKAELLILSYNDDILAQKTIAEVRKRGFTLPILVRTRDEKNLGKLQEVGATEVVPETLEASLMLASHMLMLLGHPAPKVQQQILEVQKNRYQLLRGYFLGDDDYGHLEQTPSETLHAVTLEESSFAVGKCTNQMKEAKHLLNITAFSRDGFKSPAPTGEACFKEGDVIVLRGSPEKVYKAENFLLHGKLLKIRDKKKAKSKEKKES